MNNQVKIQIRNWGLLFFLLLLSCPLAAVSGVILVDVFHFLIRRAR
jgi:hypothetical protein